MYVQMTHDKKVNVHMTCLDDGVCAGDNREGSEWRKVSLLRAMKLQVPSLFAPMGNIAL